MAQHDQVIDNGSGLAVRTDINAALAALFSSNSGPIEPSTLVPGQVWFDTAVTDQPKLWLRNADSSGWEEILFGTAAEDVLHGFRDFILTASGIWTKPSDLKALDVTLVGAGGGSGMAVATPAGTSSAGSGGGGGGAVIAHYSDVSILPATVSYTIGAGGVAGENATGGTGGTGGNTTFNLLTATGGGGGPPVVAGSTFNVAARAFAGGGVSTEPSSVAVQLILGGESDNGMRAIHGSPGSAQRGAGGGSLFVPFRPGGITGAQSAGGVGATPGGGAMGAANGASLGAANGAVGGVGRIYLREWF